MIKNTANQHVTFQLFSTLDGSPVTSGTTAVYIVGDGAAEATATGGCTHKGHGVWDYAPTQAETNFNTVAYTAVNAGAMAVTREFDLATSTAIQQLAGRVNVAVPELPAVTIPGPDNPEKTTAYVYCWDQYGDRLNGVKVYIALRSADGNGSYSDAIAMGISSGTGESKGIATMTIPRGSHLGFGLRRGEKGPWVPFAGVNADTINLRGHIGSN
jgi:hypothetical protein